MLLRRNELFKRMADAQSLHERHRGAAVQRNLAPLSVEAPPGGKNGIALPFCKTVSDDAVTPACFTLFKSRCVAEIKVIGHGKGLPFRDPVAPRGEPVAIAETLQNLIYTIQHTTAPAAGYVQIPSVRPQTESVFLRQRGIATKHNSLLRRQTLHRLQFNAGHELDMAAQLAGGEPYRIICIRRHGNDASGRFSALRKNQCSIPSPGARDKSCD